MNAARDAGQDREPIAAAASDEPPSFEDALLELNEIVVRLETGGLGLAASIAAYERGVSLLGRLHGHLAAVEERVRMLVRVDEDGRPILEASAGGTPSRTPAEPQSRDSRGESRSSGPPKPRPGRPKRLPGMDDTGEEA